MQSLHDYVFDCKKTTKPFFDTTLEEYCDINNIDINNISESHLSIFYNCKQEYFHTNNAKEKFFERINETLTSHSGKRLAVRLQKIVGDHAEVLYWENKCPHTIELVLNDDYLIDVDSFKDCTLSKTDISEKIYDELQFFNYYITRITNDYGDKTIIEIESRYSENLTNKIRSKTDILYHVALKSDLKSILKTGLRPKVGKTKREFGYRYFPEKVFLIASSNDILKDARKVIVSKGYTTNQYSIVKIDMSGHNIGLYRDDQYDSDNIVYTYEAIPAQLLSVVDIDDL